MTCLAGLSARDQLGTARGCCASSRDRICCLECHKLSSKRHIKHQQWLGGGQPVVVDLLALSAAHLWGLCLHLHNLSNLKNVRGREKETIFELPAWRTTQRVHSPRMAGQTVHIYQHHIQTQQQHAECLGPLREQCSAPPVPLTSQAQPLRVPAARLPGSACRELLAPVLPRLCWAGGSTAGAASAVAGRGRHTRQQPCAARQQRHVLQ